MIDNKKNLKIKHNIKSSNSSRAETVRSALDVLAICCVIPRVHAVFCERIEYPDDASAGINIILNAAEGEIVADAEVQKSALTALVHCVCAPICKVNSIQNAFAKCRIWVKRYIISFSIRLSHSHRRPFATAQPNRKHQINFRWR